MKTRLSTRIFKRLPAQRRNGLGPAAAIAVALAALATGGMSGQPAEGPVRMSGLTIEGLEGVAVTDAFGHEIGDVIRVDADAKGRTRYVRVKLDSGEDVRIAAFNMWLSKDGVQSELAHDLIVRRANERWS